MDRGTGFRINHARQAAGVDSRHRGVFVCVAWRRTGADWDVHMHPIFCVRFGRHLKRVAKEREQMRYARVQRATAHPVSP